MDLYARIVDCMQAATNTLGLEANVTFRSLHRH